MMTKYMDNYCLRPNMHVKLKFYNFKNDISNYTTFQPHNRHNVATSLAMAVLIVLRVIYHHIFVHMDIFNFFVKGCTNSLYFNSHFKLLHTTTITIFS